ncbi:helix-turn-helix domain-containing protein [Streptomyces sp. NPDC057302]|uniref:helix-turn-helix domain-containing protein n=1 Tax=Streptomyces sp. NPDC057302 TaxID=3346094 RepID=UPI003639EE1F
MANLAMRQRARRALGRIFRPTPRHPRTTTARTQAPLWVRGLTAGGRPVVLGVALLMCAPGEYHLARAAGWSREFAYGMPVVLSAYAGIAAAVASTRRKGDRGLWSAIIGACLALSLAMAAQVVSHLIGTGHVPASQPWLIAVTSLVPPAVVGHLLHLAATPPGTHQDTEDAAQAPAVPSVPQRPAVVPDDARLLPLVARTAPVEQDAPDVTEDGQDADGRPAPPPVLLSSDEVAAWYGVKPSTVRGWVAAERIKVHTKDGRGRNWYDRDTLPVEPAAVSS